MPGSRNRHKCLECGLWHNGRKSLCGFCEERKFGPLTEPVNGMPSNSPRANRFQVAFRRAAKPSIGGQGPS